MISPKYHFHLTGDFVFPLFFTDHRPLFRPLNIEANEYILREEIFAGINFREFVFGHFAGINFCEFGFTEDFAGINFCELSLTKDFAGINFRESALFNDFVGINLMIALRNIFPTAYGFENNLSKN